MKKKLAKRGNYESPKINKVISSKITKEDIRKRAYDIYMERESHEGTPEDDWKKSEEELYSDLGF